MDELMKRSEVVKALYCTVALRCKKQKENKNVLQNATMKQKTKQKQQL